MEGLFLCHYKKSQLRLRQQAFVTPEGVLVTVSVIMCLL